MQVRASVKCVAPDHPRNGQAGVIHAVDGDAVTVKFDLAEVPEVVAAADLLEIGTN